MQNNTSEDALNATDLTRSFIEKITLPVDFNTYHFSQHECACFIENCVNSGNMKKCIHLKNQQCNTWAVPPARIYYNPVCKERSFLVLRGGEHENQPVCCGCPKNCMCYFSHRRQCYENSMIMLKALPGKIFSAVKKLANWFASLHWITQCVFIIGASLLFGAYHFIDLVLKLIH